MTTDHDYLSLEGKVPSPQVLMTNALMIINIDSCKNNPQNAISKHLRAREADITWYREKVPPAEFLEKMRRDEEGADPFAGEVR